MGQYRIDRLNELLRDEIAQLLLRGQVKDPRVGQFISINRVDVSKDLSYGKVYVSSFLPDAQVQKAIEGLNSAAGFIQCVIAKKLTIRKFPRLTFLLDEGMKKGFYMVRKLEELEKDESAMAERQKSKDSQG